MLIYVLTEQENMYYNYFYVYVCTYRTSEYVLQVFLFLYICLQSKDGGAQIVKDLEALYIIQFSVIIICELCLSVSLLSFLP